MKRKYKLSLNENYDLYNAKQLIYNKYNIKLQKLQAKYFALLAEKKELVNALYEELTKVERDFQKDLINQRKRKYL